MIAQLGSVIEVSRHCGWTGNMETSWKPVGNTASATSPTTKALVDIDGQDSILYWIDLTTEMAFYLPHHYTG